MEASERRNESRYPLCMPTRIQCPDRDEGFGMTQNVSSTGALLGTLRPFSVGDEACLEFEVGDVRVPPVTAKVVRLERNGQDDWGLWRYLVAVHFDERLAPSVLTEVASNEAFVPQG